MRVRVWVRVRKAEVRKVVALMLTTVWAQIPKLHGKPGLFPVGDWTLADRSESVTEELDGVNA